MNTHKRTRLVSAVSLALASSFAFGQSSGTTLLEEVVVTAQKREQSIQDAPLTVNVFSGARLESAQLNDIRDLANYTPGLSMDAFPQSQPRPYIRGIGSSDRGAGGDQSAAAFIDGVYLSRPTFLSFDSFDLERVEVLKGPQGTLWGKNVVGGAIHFVTNKPTDSFDARAMLTVGNEGTFNASAMVNTPISDRVLMRAVFNSAQHDGYADNIFQGTEQDDQDRFSGRVHLKFLPTDTTDVLLSLYGSKDDNSGPARHQYSSSEKGVSNDQDGSARKTTASNTGFDEREIFGATVTVNSELGFADFTGILAYRTVDYKKSEDIDGTNAELQSVDSLVQQLDLFEEEETDVWSIEARLSGGSETNLFWQGGVFYERDDIERNQVGTLFFPAIGRDVVETITTPNITKSFAVFGEATYSFSDAMSLTGGLRWTRDEKNFGATALQEGPGRVFVRETYTGLRASDEWDEVTWRLTLDNRFSDNVLGYATVSTGFKAGGYQDTPSNPVDAVTAFDPENVTNYELGLKMDWDSFRANLSVFSMDIENQQVRDTDNETGATVTSNAGESQIDGFEAEVTFVPTESFSLGLSYAYLDARFKEFVSEGDDFSGNRISKSPEHSLTLRANYGINDVFGTGDSLDLGIDYSYTDQIFGDNSNEPPEIVDSVGLVDARATYTSASGRWDVSFWGKNLTDEEYPIHYPNFGIGTWYIFNPPMTAGVTVNWRYQ